MKSFTITGWDDFRLLFSDSRDLITKTVDSLCRITHYLGMLFLFYETHFVYANTNKLFK